MNTNTTNLFAVRRRASLFTLLLFLLLPAVVQALDFNFTVTGGNATITGYTGPGGPVQIPSTITSGPNTYQVTAIGEAAFRYCDNLVSITIPSSVQSIAAVAFADCPNLTNVSLVNGLLSIGTNTFADCPKLTSIYIPATVTGISIDYGPFYGAFMESTSLTAITVDPNNQNYSNNIVGGVPDGVLFDKGKTTLLEYPLGKSGDYVIPASVTTIQDDAFAYCSVLGNISFAPSSALASIGKEAFRNSNLTSIVIPDGTTTIGDDAFTYCTNLASVTIPGSLINWGGGAFSNCTNLATVTLGNGLTAIGNSAFAGCTSLQSVILPASVTSLQGYAFYSCTGLTAITIPGGVTSIGAYAFGDTGLTSVTIPAGVTSIGGGAFSNGNIGYDTSSLVSVTFAAPSRVTTIGPLAFQNCTSLTTITIPDSVTFIDWWAFQGCTNLTSVTMGTGVTTISYDAFKDCTSLASLQFLGSPPTLLYGAVFSGPPGSAIVYYANPAGWDSTFGGLATAQWIPPSPFTTRSDGNGGVIITGYTGSDGSLTIPAMIGLPVTGIDPGAFQNKTGITSLGFAVPSNITVIGDNAFQGCSGLTGSVTIPSGVLTLGKNAFQGCTGITCVIIPETVAAIPSNAFADCSSLAIVYFDGAPPGPGTDTSVFSGDSATAYYLPGTGWDGLSTFDGLPTELFPYTYQPDGTGGYTITGYTGTVGNIVIPATIGGLSVTGIQGGAFQNNAVITSVGFASPSGITSIGDNAFQSCANLSSVAIPDSVTSIGYSAFYSCALLNNVSISTNSSLTSINGWAFANSALSSIYIPGGVTFIDYGVFYSCTSLAAITVDGNNKNYSNNIVGGVADGVLFDKGITTLIQYPAGDPATDYTIPGTVTAISDYAFQDSSNLTGAMHIPTGVTSIGNYAFQNCTGLGGVSIPSSVTSIGYAPFYSCISLTAITVDGNNKNYSNNIVGGVADGVLFNKGKTTLIQYPQDKSGDYVIPAGVTSIGYNAFASCTKLTGITFPSGITGIAQGEFLSCTSLTTVIIPASVTHIDNSAFAYCYNLASVSNTPGGTTLPGSITSIGDYAFIDTGLTSVTIPAGVASIGNDAFYNCNKLASLTFATPSQVTGIGAYAFFHCSNLTSVTIPAGVTTIGNQAFYYCTALTKAKFAGNAPTTMGGNVFDLAAAGFQVDYYSNATGFTTPTWDGYASVAESPGSTMTNWMVKKGYPSTTDPLSVPNFGGVSLLLAYALNIDPSQNMIASLPKAAVAGNQFGFSFYAGCPDVTYIVEISSDCKNWSNSGVTVSTQDANGNRTATIPVSNGPHFMRLRVSY